MLKKEITQNHSCYLYMGSLNSGTHGDIKFKNFLRITGKSMHTALLPLEDPVINFVNIPS